MRAAEHLQLTEVLDYLQAKSDCAIIHPDSGHEVAIEFDRVANWNVHMTLKGGLEAAVKKKLKATALKTKSREMYMSFGPDRGKTIQLSTVTGSFDRADTAARAALSMFDIVWQVPASEWLWVTAMLHDERRQPKRPTVWPPTGM